MRLNFGRWRFRAHLRRLGSSSAFADRTVLPEGIVYRLRFSLWMLIVLADCQPEHERSVRRQAAMSAWAQMEEDA